MRPVCRGPWPTRVDGHHQSFAGKRGYQQAKDPLISSIGDYCCYCERSGDLHVEHVVPKSVDEKLKEEWSNFLLGCGNCNSRKLNNNISRYGYLWPDKDDTISAFSYRSGGRISVAEGMESSNQIRAHALFDLVGLGAEGSNTDQRRHKRRQAWDKAEMIRKDLDDEISRKYAIVSTSGTGFSCVWMAVFCEDDDMCRRLVEAFPGTRGMT